MSLASDNKNWADEYISQPLHGLTPAEETGIGGTYAAGYGPKQAKGTPGPAARHSTGASASSTSTNPFRRERKPTEPGASPAASPSASSSKKGPTSRVRAVSSSASIGSARREAFGAYATASPDARSSRRSVGSAHASSPPPAPSSSAAHGGGPGNGKAAARPRRSSSLRERYPGDPSVRPLDQLAREAKAAHRSPHLRKKHLPGSDTIDRLDDASALGAYHHEGPYDAASLARNNSYTMSPVAAVEGTNREALKATPAENVRDAVRGHRPLEGTSAVPPGVPDRYGRTYHYREGPEEDMMRHGAPEGGAYRRYEGIPYLPDDLKGKGEPAFTLEKQLKLHKRAARAGEGEGVELTERPRHSASGEHPDRYVDVEADEEERTPFGDEAATGAGQAEAGASSSGHDATAATTTPPQKYGEWEKGHGKTGSGGSFSGLKRRIGSLRLSSK